MDSVSLASSARRRVSSPPRPATKASADCTADRGPMSSPRSLGTGQDLCTEGRPIGISCTVFPDRTTPSWTPPRVPRGSGSVASRKSRRSARAAWRRNAAAMSCPATIRSEVPAPSERVNRKRSASVEVTASVTASSRGSMPCRWVTLFWFMRSSARVAERWLRQEA
ncbi:hypothetical protein ACFFX0_25805 [Citricoccus parietis]|uniref:Uncharacterized protein n=1 Tax=Citricoccus parietis TaxID=592307 RepID=A0ABV5G715_9MICC